MYYLTTHPKTVVSIVRYGKIPEGLPDWAKVNYLFCTKTIESCFQGNKAPLNQTFVLRLEVPEKNSIQDNFLLLDYLEPNDIKEIYVYSQVGLNLLTRLFNGNCPIAITIQPDVFTNSPDESKKRPRTEIQEEEISSNKRHATANLKNLNSNQTNKLPSPKEVLNFQPLSKTGKTNIIIEKKFNPSQSFGNNSTQLISKKIINSSPQFKLANTQLQVKKMPDKKMSPEMVDRLSTYAEHIELLKETFATAQYSILVTSYSINHETLLKANLYNLIPAALDRGVKIYIYYNDVKNLDNKVINFFEKYNVFPQETYTHSKILCADNYLVATGSFNWLSTLNSKYQESDEGSFVFRGDICADLKEDFWSYIKYYRNIQFENESALERFEGDSENESTIIYELNRTTELAYIPTLEEHCGFFTECFTMAKHQLIICSPFISSAGAYENDINPKLLKETTRRGVDIFFICSPEADGLKSFKAFLSQVNSPKIHLIITLNIHLKTIIVDKYIIAEGSFNWLSATRNALSDYHNHEQTLYVQGSLAKNLIEKFFKSRVGLLIQNQIPKLTNVAHQLPFFQTLNQPTQRAYQRTHETENSNRGSQKTITTSQQQNTKRFG